MFSVSTIYSAKDFLCLASKNTLTTSEFLLSFKKYQFDTATNVLKLVTECGWIHLGIDGQIKLSKRGEVISKLNYRSALVKQLEDMILIYNPNWASFLTKGRSETIRFLPDEPKQCFKEAGFMGDLTSELIDVWDRLSLAYRNYSNKQKLETGRIGERLSLEYETKRTGIRPTWQAIESNLSGYDLLSTVSKEDKSFLLIEVKSSTSKLNYAKFYLTKNEWKVALSSENYILHLWVLHSQTEHYIIPFKNLEEHISQNKGDGEWESVCIPFKSVL
ncbi:DUF3883 domain-containing protein [Winogradskyella ouciana]|uniref:DUF3883 domain-containing protein n=1 Tax=Winogradskyella ouciana TaxID=2608631 RepID=A0A7K1GCJ3_9FLAO|nr:DUF3883 domain-containing protein [Winogradskyella ouciana]MTE27022.1 DUF3883 domain-containing protein [Winogradskyella ouciana]